MELKYHIVKQFTLNSGSFNRTFMELKCTNDRRMKIYSICFNRTFMELKSKTCKTRIKCQRPQSTPLPPLFSFVLPLQFRGASFDGCNGCSLFLFQFAQVVSQLSSTEVRTAHCAVLSIGMSSLLEILESQFRVEREVELVAPTELKASL